MWTKLKKMGRVISTGSDGSEWTVLFTLMCLCFGEQIGQVQGSIQDGGVITIDTVVHDYETPMLIKNDIIVQENAKLILEPGVELQFAPGVTLGVNGTLIAKGTPSRRIKLTKDPGTGTADPKWPSDIRLVDERTVTRGRLQMYHKGRWRGVCANFQNWTQTDTNVTCRQLGFKNGTFSFISFATNDSMYMLYHKPDCRGNEDHIMDCPGSARIQIGSRICENQQTVHLVCDGLASGVAQGHWSGLEFFNSTHVVVQDQPSIKINKSASVLEFVDIEFAGVDKNKNPTPAVRAAPLPPRLYNVAVRYSALDGTNFTDVKTSTDVAESLFLGNRGHGLVVETHYGRVRISDTEIHHNMGNGIKAKFLDGKWPFYEGETLCEEADQFANTYPYVVSGIPTIKSTSYCKRTFKTGYGQILTLNIVEMNKEDAASGTITVIDGDPNIDTDKVLAKIPIINGTMPQGITSTRNIMGIRFDWNRLPSECPRLIDCIKFTIIMDSGKETIPEFDMSRSIVHNNTQHGAYVENARNYVFINESILSHNGYGAGLRIYGGASDVHVNSSYVDYNNDNGVNITHDGGWRIFNMSSFSYNQGHGINITFNETSVDNKTRIAKHQKTEVWWSNINRNEGSGMRVGNYCRNSLHNVNDSNFIQNKKDGLEFESCFKIIPDANVTNMTAGWNKFDGNEGHGIRIQPLINAVGRIGNNTFENHPRHALLIDNSDDYLKIREYYTMKVDFEVTSNIFRDNEGFYVANLRLTQGSALQRLDFKYNTIEDNVIEGAFPALNPRLRAHAVIIISSNNVNVSRNYLVNPKSKYELATHLLDRSSVIEATRNWWGTIDYHQIITRIFDQFNRYNLAILQYHPVLKYEDELYGTNEDYVTNRQRPEEVKFVRGTTLGGRLAYHFTTEYGESHYYVDRDLTILPEGRLTILPGTTLEFPNGLGMLVHGQLDADANEREHIKLMLKDEETTTNHTLVRLVDGKDDFEGRLEIRPTEEDEWGTVCRRGWTIRDSSVVCQMLGMVVHPDDWRMFTDVPGDIYQPIWRSQVQCTDLDMDITQCVADGTEDHSCDHSIDVSVRCHKPTWSGVRLLATAQRSTFDYVTITDTGLMDPTVVLYAPAIHIDYNRHRLERLTITRAMADGIEIVRNHAYSNCKLSYSDITNNMGNGVSIRAPFFEIEFSNLTSNAKTGFMYNPHYTSYEALQLRTGIHDSEVINDITANGLHIREDGFHFLTTRENAMEEDRTYDVEIRVDTGYKVVIDVLDYNPDVTQEKVTVYDGRKSAIRPGTINWAIEEDLVDYPVVSSGNVATLRWKVTGPASGRAAFVVTAKRHSWEWPFPDLIVRNTTVFNNTHGIVTRHYNQPSNEFYDLFFRYRWQTISIHGVHFKKNKEIALHVPSITKYHEFYVPTYQDFEAPFRVAEIIYALEDSFFENNGDMVKGEHNHVEFSNNVWIWQVTNNVFERNRGAFSLELPKVNLMYQELYNHSVDVNDTVFETNENFEFRIDGFYCNSSVARNRFQYNKCRIGCITFTGTEKDFDIQENQIYDNMGKYMMEFYMNSHTPYTRWVDAIVMYNEFKRNKKYETYVHSVSSSPDTYTLGIRGVQNITLNRNLFKNEMDYEMVAGQSSNILENYLDVTENYWGTDNQIIIKGKLFDFDDWNNYAIAEYYPYLLLDSFDSPTSTGGKIQGNLDLDQPLGGRIEQPMTLAKRDTPYIVHKDLTIMPMASLYIEAGVELQFYPNVGMLVLGSLTVRGYPDERVKFGPIDLRNIGAQGEVGRRKRDTDAMYGDVYKPIENRPQPGDPGEHGAVRLVGGDHPYEGFMEIYNATERRWTIICDSSFSRETAEVGCRNMGLETSNVIVRRFRYYDIFVLGFPLMHEQVIEWFHRYSYVCEGTENGFDQCRFKINIGLPVCMDRRDYVFVRCGPRNLADNYEYWGNIRFSTPEYKADKISPGFSSLEFLDIYGAGMLHEEHAAAVQAVYRTPTTDHVRITNCAWNGYDFIAPKDEFLVLNNVIENNHGYGIGGLALNGDSNYDVRMSTFRPLVENQMPYNTFGVVRMCTSEKLIYVKERVLLYFKYDYENVDCIKVLRSEVFGENKRMALRFLQINLYNDTFYRNAVEMYNGDYFEPELLIGAITGNSTMDEKRQKFETSRYFDTMGIRITASAAHGSFGFIAEVVTVPVSPGWKPILGPGLRQWIMNTAITGNEAGGFSFQNVGELNPTVLIEGCRIQNCGLKMLNMTSPGVIDMYIQNTRMCTIANNFIGDNAAGIYVETYSNVNSNALYANISNNVIIYTTHGEPLHVEGHYFQGFYIKNNFISHNRIAHRNVVSLFGIQANFTLNTLTNNTARTIINASVPSNIDINQRFDSNYIYGNLAIGGNFTTIFLYSPRFLIRENFLFNTHNMFELVTFNRTKPLKWDDNNQVYPQVEAESNFWGSPNPAYVAGRIWERKDDDNLIGVRFEPFHTKNTSVLQGKCPPGFRLYDKVNSCYMYMGAVLPYHEAVIQCNSNGARMGWSRHKNVERFMGELVSSAQENYNEKWRVWVDNREEDGTRCSVLQDYKIELYDCNLLLPYICERDPYVIAEMYWRPIIIVLGIIAAAIIIIIMMLVFAWLKARSRTKERLDRRNSLRQSIRSSKASVLANSRANLTTPTPSGANSLRGSKRRRPPLTKVDMTNGILDLSGVTVEETDTDSMQKYKYGYDYDTRRTIDSRRNLNTHRPGTPPSSVDYDYSLANKLDASSYFESDLQDNYYPHRLENEIARIPTKPMYDPVLQGDIGYDDQSLIRDTPQKVPARPVMDYSNVAYDDQSLDRSYAGSPRRIPARPAFDYSTQGYGYDDLSMDRPSPMPITSPRRPPSRPELDFVPVRPSPPSSVDRRESPASYNPSPAVGYRPGPQSQDSPVDYRESPHYQETNFDRHYQSSPRRVVPARPALDRSSSSEYLSDKPKPKETAM